MYTKEYLFAQKTRLCTYSGGNCGALPVVCCDGSTRYIGPSSGSGEMTCFLYPGYISTSASSQGANFSDDSEPFTGISNTRYNFPSLSNVVVSHVSSASAINGNKLHTTIRYQLNNTGSTAITIHKYFIRATAKLFNALGPTTSSPTDRHFLGVVQEITPVTINAGETAIIDVTIETEIPE